MNRLVKQWGNNPAVPCNFDLDFIFQLDEKEYKGLQSIFDKLAYYEDLEEKELLIIKNESITNEKDDIYKIVEQVCEGCGSHFSLKYCADGTYEYIGDVCDCEADFHPVDGEPSMSEWMETRKRMEEIKKKIEDYVSTLLHQHDMTSWRNENNQKTMNKIVAKCMGDLETHEGLLEEFENDSQIKYFVRQTILYMI